MTTANILSQLGSPGVSTGFKNRIINGAMVISQRGTSFSAGGYTLDRWVIGTSTAGAWTVQQTTGAPAGFINSLAFTKTTGNAPASTEASYLYQAIEGYNIADLGWGTANAKAVTLSFWVYSGATGTFSGSLRNLSATQAYPFTYVVSSANTWTYCSVTIPGSTTGTWEKDNNAGIYLFFDLGCGSAYRGTAGSWQGGNLLGVIGTSTYPTSTSGGSMSFTGVQLEVGTTATNYEVRSYGTELQLCQRYYEQLYFTASGYSLMSGPLNGFNNNWIAWVFKVQKRAAPTVGFKTGGWSWGSGAGNISSYPAISHVSWSYPGDYFYGSGSSGNPSQYADSEL